MSVVLREANVCTFRRQSGIAELGGVAVTRFKVDANPEVLEWARTSIALTREQAAKKVGVSAIQVQEWEEGGEEPSFAQLCKMADVYKRPVAVLLLPSPPKDFEPLRDFRLLPENQDRAWSPALHAELRRVQVQREVARELAQLEGEAPQTSNIDVRLTDDVDGIGETIWTWLEVSERLQRSNLSGWIRLIEGKAILVTQTTGVDLEEMRGCSLSGAPFSAIMLNGGDSERGRLFTLLHELTHILLRVGGLCDLADANREVKTEKERIERFCNQVAAATLIPRSAILRDAQVAAAKAGYRWSDDDLARLAKPYGVSQEALLRRLFSLGRTSWDFYLERRTEYLTIYEESRQRQKEKGTGFANPHQTKVRNLGRRFVASVLDAYYRDDISGSDLAGYLQTKIDYLPKIEAIIGANV